MTEDRIYLLVAVDKRVTIGLDGFPAAARIVRECMLTDLFEDQFAVADVTDLLMSYNRTTLGDPWDKPYPAMYAELVDRLA